MHAAVHVDICRHSNHMVLKMLKHISTPQPRRLRVTERMRAFALTCDPPGHPHGGGGC